MAAPRHRVLLTLAIPLLVVVLLVAAWAIDTSAGERQGPAERRARRARTSVTCPRTRLAASVAGGRREVRRTRRCRSGSAPRPTRSPPASSASRSTRTRRSTAPSTSTRTSRWSARPFTWLGSFASEREAPLHFTVSDTQLEQGLRAMDGDVRGQADRAQDRRHRTRAEPASAARPGRHRPERRRASSSSTARRDRRAPDRRAHRADRAQADRSATRPPRQFADDRSTRRPPTALEVTAGQRVVQIPRPRSGPGSARRSQPTASTLTLDGEQGPRRPPRRDRRRRPDEERRLHARQQPGADHARARPASTCCAPDTRRPSAQGRPAGQGRRRRSSLQERQARVHHRGRPEARHQGAGRHDHRVEGPAPGQVLHDLPRLLRGPGHEHPPHRRPRAGRDRQAGRDVLAQRPGRPAHHRRRASSRPAPSTTACTTPTSAAACRSSPRPCSTPPSSPASTSSSYQSHSIHFDRYPYGREATLGWENPDQKCKNNTPYGVMIWTSYTDTCVTVTLYSTQNVYGQQTGQTSVQGRARAPASAPSAPGRGPTATRASTTSGRLYRPAEGVDCPGL